QFLEPATVASGRRACQRASTARASMGLARLDSAWEPTPSCWPARRGRVWAAGLESLPSFPRVSEVPRAARRSGAELPRRVASVRADEQETDLSLLQDAFRIPVPQLLGMAEAGIEQLQRFLAVEPEGSAEPDHGLVDDKGPAVRALRLVRGHWLRTDGTQDPG